MARRKKGEPIDGWIILDKPLGLSSTKAVSIVRRLMNARKAGHAGTLDPLASGVLPIALGEATKTVAHIMESEKIYHFTVAWGRETSTDDLEGETTATSLKRPSKDEIDELLPDFTGNILQSPPAFSAIKLNGQRAYTLARKGETVEIPLREVQIHQLKLEEPVNEEVASFTVSCGKGTYIRALARDMGRELGCLGHVVNLRRVKTGPFHENMSISLEKLEELGHSALAREALLKAVHPIETALDDIPALAVSESEAERIKNGQAVTLTAIEAPILKGPAYTRSGNKLIAVGAIEQGTFKPTRVFNLDGGNL